MAWLICMVTLNCVIHYITISAGNKAYIAAILCDYDKSNICRVVSRMVLQLTYFKIAVISVSYFPAVFDTILTQYS